METTGASQNLKQQWVLTAHARYFPFWKQNKNTK